MVNYLWVLKLVLKVKSDYRLIYANPVNFVLVWVPVTGIRW